jgi:hypothetical protein
MDMIVERVRRQLGDMRRDKRRQPAAIVLSRTEWLEFWSVSPDPVEFLGLEFYVNDERNGGLTVLTRAGVQAAKAIGGTKLHRVRLN